MTHRVLVVDDEGGIRDSIARILRRESYEVLSTDSGERALQLVRAEPIDLVLADIMMPKMNGLELLRAIKAIAPSVEVVMMTAFGTIENAVECMREGAYDFISKPLKRAMVVRSVHRALERHRLMHENLKLRAAASLTGRGDVVGESRAIRQVLEVLEQAAPTEAAVLLAGESGVGKEILARFLHERSERAAGPWVSVNCGALAENLLEAELFGHERGAFTGASDLRMGRFERASGGTIFLDEVSELSAALQIRILRLLQEQKLERVGGEDTVPVDVRVVAATRHSLSEAVAAGDFREDLFYRLSVIQLDIPALRERPGDVALLAQHFLKIYSEKNKKNIEGFGDSALKALDAYAWPGNVRELENAIERAVVLSRTEVLALDAFSEDIRNAVENKHSGGDGMFIPFGMPLEEVERRLIEATLKKTGGNKNTTARLLGVATRTIYRKLEQNAEVE